MRLVHVNIEHGDRISTLRCELNETCLRLGFDHSTFGIFGLPDATAFCVTTYPDSWSKHYEKEKYYLTDPAIHLAVQSPTPVDWRVAENFDKVGIFDKFKAAGLGNCGITFPLQGGYGERAVFTVSKNCSYKVWDELMESKRAALEAEAIKTHKRALEVWNLSAKFGLEKLSNRQVEILQYVAGGKNAKDIATILGISHKTVENQLRNARQRLKAMNTHQAVARAIGLGVIYPA